MEKLIREVRFLKIYAIVLTVVCSLLIVSAFRPGDDRQRFQEIDVERINVIEKDGTLKMVISNKERQHPGLVNGQPIKPRVREAGMIFFNEIGDECGGLIYEGDGKGSAMIYSVDQRDNDQIMQLQYAEGVGEDKKRAYGLKLWDRPESFPLEDNIKFHDSINRLNDKDAYKRGVEKLKAEGKISYERFFAGKTSDGSVGLFIRDDKGRPRIQIYVGKDNQPHIDYLDEKGQPAERK
jgi:hypothetical protein